MLIKTSIGFLVADEERVRVQYIYRFLLRACPPAFGRACPPSVGRACQPVVWLIYPPFVGRTGGLFSVRNFYPACPVEFRRTIQPGLNVYPIKFLPC